MGFWKISDNIWLKVSYDADNVCIIVIKCIRFPYSWAKLCRVILYLIDLHFNVDIMIITMNEAFLVLDCDITCEALARISTISSHYWTSFHSE